MTTSMILIKAVVKPLRLLLNSRKNLVPKTWVLKGNNIGLGFKLIVMTDSALFFISSTDSTADPDPIIGTPLLCIAL